MKIRTAEFLKGIRGTDPILYDGVPQIAFIGRSNVGKSSLINRLVNRNELVKVGKKPGKTTEINFFSINKQFYFVDLPGYGYAKVDPEEREKIKKLILWYLMYSEVRHFAVVLILDAKAGFTEFDMDLLEILRDGGHHYIIVANKIDKLNQKEKREQLEKIRVDSGEQEIIAHSSETKEGTDVLLKKIFE